MFINIFELWNSSLHFHIFQGARGCGKTDSVLRGLVGLEPDYYKPTGKFMLVRRLDDDCETIASDKTGDLNPFISINDRYGTEYNIKKLSKHLWGFYDDWECKGNVVGYMCALTTIGKVRGGGSFNDVTVMLGDEFAPEKYIRSIPGEGKAWLSAYESVCRNREYTGLDAVQMIWLSNSDDFNNKLCSYLDIINDIERLVRKHQYGKKYWPERDLEYHLLETPEEFREFKLKSAIGKISMGTDYADMAIDNKFAYNDFSLIEKRSIKHYRPLFAIDDVYVWYNDNNSTYYATYCKGSVLDYYKGKNMHDRMAIRRNWKLEFTRAFTGGRFLFETFIIKHTIIDIMIEGGGKHV